VEVGVITAGGAEETTTSTLIIITISLTTPIGKTSEIVPRNSLVADEATAGSTIHSTVAELPMEIGRRQISTAAQPVELPLLTVKPMHGDNSLVSRAAVDSRQAQWIAAVPVAGDSRAPATERQGEATE